MKKFLSLVLALIMVMSLVTVGAGAVTFTDAEDINYPEAVEVMASLGILSGYNGAFDPQGNLTRGAAAKIVAYVALGKGAATLSVDEKPFPDVEVTSSVAPYIEWAADKGIVNGYTSGNFGPKNTVSGHAFLKMLLNVLGIEGTYTGTGWQVNVVANAEDAGLFEDIDTDEVDLSTALTRELAAQLAFNALTYTPDGAEYWVVNGTEFDNATDAAIYAALISTDEDKYIPQEETDLSESLAGKNYKLACESAVVVISTPETTEDDAEEGTTQVVPYAGGEGTAFEYAASKDLVGHVVNVYYKDYDGEGEGYDADYDTVYTMVAQSSEVKVSSTKNGLKYTEVNALLGTDLTSSDITKTTGTKIVTTAYSVSNYVTDFAEAEDEKSTATAVQYKKTGSYDGLTVSSGTYIVYDEQVIAKKSTSSSVELYDVTVDEDGYVEVLNSNGDEVYVTAEDEDDCVALVTSEVDWEALVDDYDEETTVALNTVKVGEFLTLSVPEVVTGYVTKVDTSSSSGENYWYIYVDGVKYKGKSGVDAKVSAYVADNDLTPKKDDDGDTIGWSNSFSYTTEYDFYLDADGKVFAYERADGSTEGTLIVPIKLYANIDYVEDAYDDYGDVDEDNVSSYSIWLQAVDMNGDIVSLQVGSSEYVYEISSDVELRKIANDAVYKLEDDAYFVGQFATYTTYVDDDTDEDIAAIAKVWGGYYDNDEAQNTVAEDDADDLTSSSKKVIGGGDTKNPISYYMTDGFKVIYIEGTGSDAEVVVKNGTYSQIVEGARLYGEKEDSDDSYYELKYVLILDDTSSIGEDVIYVKSALNTKTETTYVDDDGDVQKGYENTVYINGEKVTILTTKTEANSIKEAGFYTYKVESDGTYDLTLTEDENVVKAKLTGNYKGVISVEGVEDYDATDAVIVNLLSSTSTSELGYDDVPTKASKLVVDGTTTVSFIYDEDEETISVIYVTAYADQD